MSNSAHSGNWSGLSSRGNRLDRKLRIVKRRKKTRRVDPDQLLLEPKACCGSRVATCLPHCPRLARRK